MFEVKEGLKAAFAEIENLEVISSSWIAARKKNPVPCVIVDMDGVTPVLQTEDGSLLARQYSFPLSAVVSLANGDEEAERELETIVDAIEAKLIEKIGSNNYTIDNFFTMNIPWGNGEALAGSFQLKVIQ